MSSRVVSVVGVGIGSGSGSCSGGWRWVEGGEVDGVAIYFPIVEVGVDLLRVGGGDVVGCAPDGGRLGVGWLDTTLLSLLLGRAYMNEGSLLMGETKKEGVSLGFFLQY